MCNVFTNGTGSAAGFSVSQSIPGGSLNRIISVEGSLGECEAVVVKIVWNTTNTGGIITGDWTVKANDVNLALPLAGLTCN